MQTRARDTTQQPIATTLEQPGEFLDELSFLRQRIALLEHALTHARRLAHFDDMTGLPNRRLLEDRFQQAKARSDRQLKSVAVLFLDIDGFKDVNDAHGHVIGDDLLRRVATRLASCVRSSDTVCRYGGDEFVILLPESDGRRAAISATRKMHEQLSTPYFVGATPMALPVSIGMALYPTDGMELDRLIEEADSAMYREKIGKHAETHAPQRLSADPPTNSADVAGEDLEPKRTCDKRESGYSLEEDAFTNEGAPPPSAPHIDFTARNSK
jgi:diguanylate cyclase (GGDEF)-like protein